MTAFDVDDTVAAIASAPGSAIRGIIRISGPNCRECLQRVFQRSDGESFESRGTPSRLPVTTRLPDGNRLPGELLYWPTRRSYTRQPSAEFHTFGSPPLLKQVLASICRAGARLARPGEFTLRAFLSGRLDLTQAEAVLAVIDAQGETQLAEALKQLAGGLSGPLSQARDQLIFVLAELEAGLDFVEEDIEFINEADLVARLESVLAALRQVTEQIVSRELTAGAFKVALIGSPNAGKSSLFNKLLGQNLAIVTNVAGTTTDFLTAALEVGGPQIEIIDTAGQEDTADSNPQSASVATQAQQQRCVAEMSSHLRLLCVDTSRPLPPEESNRLVGLEDATIVVQTKADLGVHASNRRWLQQLQENDCLVVTSCHQELGVEKLRTLIREFAIRHRNSESEIVGSTVLRTAESLRTAEQSANLALQAVYDQAGEEIVAAELRHALDNLGSVLGTVYTDDILDVVFGRFCIGK